jgi:hypothetical protein
MYIGKSIAVLLLGLALLGGVFAYAALNMELGKISYRIVVTPTTVTSTTFNVDMGDLNQNGGYLSYSNQFTLTVSGDQPAHLMFNLTNRDILSNDFYDFNLTIELYDPLSPSGIGNPSVKLYAPSDATHPSCVEIYVAPGNYNGNIYVTYVPNGSLSSTVERVNMTVVQLVQDGTCASS